MEEFNKNIDTYLEAYFEIQSPQYAVLVTGKWGAGKTFYIKKKIEGWNTKSRDSNNTIRLKPIYVSLYGLSTVQEINQKIKEVLNPLLYSKEVKFLKKIFLGAVNTVTHLNFDANDDGKSDGKVSFNINSLGLLKSSDSNIKGNKVLIFDDLERCKIDLEELFGFINEFVEHFSCKVLLLCDEEKLMESSKEKGVPYKSFKEKLIGQTFVIQTDSFSAIETFINDAQNVEYDESLVKLISELFIASEICNLRILKQAIYDFDRFVKLLDRSFINNDKYKEFLESLLGHFLLVYFEYKSGNDSIEMLTTINFFDKKGVGEQINAKYGGIFARRGIPFRNQVIDYSYIISFAKHGFCDKIELNKSIAENVFFRSENEMNWEKLWNWERLEDSDFDAIYGSVINDLNNCKYDNVFHLMHAVTIQFSLIKHNIINEDKDKYILIYKEQFDSILKQNANDRFPKYGDSSWGKVYREKDSEEFKEIIEYSNRKIHIHNQQIKDDYLREVFECLKCEDVYYLEEKLNKRSPDTGLTYSSNPILTTVDGAKLAKQLLLMKNDCLEFFFIFLEKRYIKSNVSRNDLEDKTCIIKLRDSLLDEVSNLQRVKKHNIQKYITFLDVLIDHLPE